MVVEVAKIQEINTEIVHVQLGQKEIVAPLGPLVRLVYLDHKGIRALRGLLGTQAQGALPGSPVLMDFLDLQDQKVLMDATVFLVDKGNGEPEENQAFRVQLGGLVKKGYQGLTGFLDKKENPEEMGFQDL